MYENSFCPHLVCSPSRYSLLTSNYIHQHLGLTNKSSRPSILPTLPSILKNAVYSTTAVGKMHFTPTYMDIGFDNMFLAEQCSTGRYEDDYHRWLKAEEPNTSSKTHLSSKIYLLIYIFVLLSIIFLFYYQVFSFTKI